MNLSNLRRASDWEVEKWLKDNLDLTPYQEEKLTDNETVRFSPFYFYQHVKAPKAAIIWRLTLPFYCLYWLILLMSLPMAFIFTGKWGYGRGFYDKFYAPWHRKIGLN